MTVQTTNGPGRASATLRSTAVRNLAVLHQEATPMAVRQEIDRLVKADRLAWCLVDLRVRCDA